MRTILISSILLSLVVGFGGGWWYGLVDAEKKINASLPEISRNLPMQNFYAPIKEIKGDAILIEGPKSPNPLENLPEIREVVIGSDTKIIRKTQKDSAVFAAENAKFQEELQNVDPSDPTPPVAPLLYTDEELKLSDLKVGDVVSVVAAKDVRTEKRFVAVSITLNIGGTVNTQNTEPAVGGSTDPALTPPPKTPDVKPVDPTFVP